MGKFYFAFASPIHMRQLYTRVNLLLCAIFTRGKQITQVMLTQIHTGVNLHTDKFTPWSDEM